MRTQLAAALLTLAFPAAAAESLNVADVLDPAELSFAAQTEGVRPAIPGAVVPDSAHEHGVDVIDDPRGADERPSDVEPRFDAAGTRDTVGRWSRRAFSVLAAARGAAGGPWRGIFSAVSGALSRSQVSWPAPGRDFQACGESTLAFVFRGGSTIHLCARVAHGRVSDKAAAQILIHEAAHVQGYYNECEATRVEVNAMTLSGEGLAFRNDYMPRCGIN